MAQTPFDYANNPVSGTQYWSKMWCGVVASGESVTAHVNAYTGTNGSGSLIAVTTLTAEVWDQTSNAALNTFTGSSANTTTVSSATTSGHWIKVSGKYTGSAIGSLRFYLVYSTSSPFVPTTPSFTPTAGGIGTSVAITGSLFTDATIVNFNGTAANGFTVNSDTSITATVATGTTTGLVTVGNPAGTTNSSGNFTVSQAWINTGTSGTPVWSAGVVYINTGTPSTPVWTEASGVSVNTGTPASPVWTPGG